MAGVRQFDEEQVFNQALEVFWRKGFLDTTMQDLAAATGVQRGSLYNAYHDKETLFLHVFDRYRDRYLEQMRAALAHGTLREGLERFFDYLIGSMTYGEPTRGCLSTKTALGGDVIDAPIREALQSLVNRQEALVRARLAQPDAEYELLLPPDEAARLVIAVTRGIVVIERIFQDRARLHTTARSLLDILLRKHSAAAAS